MKEFWGSLPELAVWVAFSSVLVAVALGLDNIFGRWGVTEGLALAIGATVGLSIVLVLLGRAVGKQRKSKRVQREQLEEEKADIVHMIDEVLQEKE